MTAFTGKLEGGGGWGFWITNYVVIFEGKSSSSSSERSEMVVDEWKFSSSSNPHTVTGALVLTD